MSGLALLFLAQAMPQAQAQSNEPQRRSGPILLFPGAGSAAGSAGGGAASPAAPAAAPRGIRVDRLDAGAVDSLGVLDVADGGLGYDLWRGSDRAAVLRLLPLLPALPATPTRRALAVRLLLSTAAPPNGPSAVGNASGGNTSGRGGADSQVGTAQGLLRARAERLMAMGEVAGLRELLRVVPQARAQEADLAEFAVEAALFDGDREEACGAVRNGVARYSGQDFWNEGLIYCQILADDRDAATLGIDLLRERGGGSHPDFLRLALALQGYGEAPSLETVRPLDIAMLADVGRLSAEDESLPPGALGLRLAAAENPLQRAAIAEDAAEDGALSALELAQIYRDLTFTPDELAQALSLAPSLTEGTRVRALLFQAAEQPILPAARAELLEAFLTDGRASALPLATAHAALPLVEALPLAPELAWFAAIAGRVLLLGERAEQAEAWLTLAQRQALVSPESRAAAVALSPYALLAGLEGGGSLSSWYADWAAAAAEGQEVLLAVLLQSLGRGPDPDWSRLIATPDARQTGTAEGGSGPLSAAIYGAQTAARAGRRGEAVLFSLLALSPAAAASVTDPLVLGPAIAAISASGLDAPALGLAIEAAYLADL